MKNSYKQISTDEQLPTCLPEAEANYDLNNYPQAKMMKKTRSSIFNIWTKNIPLTILCTGVVVLFLWKGIKIGYINVHGRHIQNVWNYGFNSK